MIYRCDLKGLIILKKLLKKILPVLALLPLVIGTIGYIVSGEMFSNSLYASFALYFTNPISDEYNICVEIARWTAPLVTATTILCAFQNVWESLKNRISLLWKKDKVAVYSDDECVISFGNGVCAIYPGEKFKKYANNHIIMFSTDEKSILFYEKHKNELEGSRTYIGIKDMDCSLLNSIKNVTFFDVNNSIARLLWKEIALWNKGNKEYNIAIWGDSGLAGYIVYAGLQLNLFSEHQKIRYHFITDNELFRIRHSELRLMNNDELIYYKKSDNDLWNAVSNADIVIVADIMDAELLQTLVIKVGESPLYYYSPNEEDLVSYISCGRIIPFGRKKDVFTDDNIRSKRLIGKAIALNEHYANQYGTEKDWDSLTGFLKASNISASDFGEVLSILSKELNEDELARLEHIRWCRFYYLNYYTLGTPNNGKNRDDKRRIHKDLIPYDELDSAEKIKDIEAIRITQNLHK